MTAEIKAAILFVLLVAIGLAAWGVKYTIDAYNKTQADNAHLKDEIKHKDSEITKRERDILRKQEQIDRSEQVSAARAERATAAERNLYERDRIIAELRRKNPSVDAFLAQRVPPELRDGTSDAATGGAGVQHSDPGSTASSGTASH